jgi:hypothetical protein
MYYVDFCPRVPVQGKATSLIKSTVSAEGNKKKKHEKKREADMRFLRTFVDRKW